MALVKQVLDVDQITAEKDGTLRTQGVPLKLSNYDKNAIEAAVKLKEKLGGKSVALATGPNIREGVKEALAMGCDEAFVISAAELSGADNLALSRILAEAIKKIGGVEIVTLGEGSLDSYSSLLAGRLAARLGWPMVSFAISIEIAGNLAKVRSRTAGVVESFELPLPCIVSVSEEINQPRLPPLLQILQAGKKPTTELKVADLGGKGEPGIEMVSNRAPTMERKNVVLKGTPAEAAQALAKALQKEGVI